MAISGDQGDVVGILKTKSVHSLLLVWSMPTSVTTSAFISVADSVTLTNTVPDGSTVGSVLRFVKPPPSLSTLKSPDAIVGLL